MKKQNLYFSNNGHIKIIHEANPNGDSIEVIELGYGRAQNRGKYVLIRDCYILQFVISGHGKFCGEDFYAGDVIAISPGQVEVREPDPENLYECAWVMVKGPVAAELLRSVYPKGRSTFSFGRTKEASEKIKLAVDGLWEDREVSFKYSMLGTFYSVLSLFSDKEEKRTDPVSSALTYMNLNYKEENLKISDVSAFSGVTQNHLCKLFKKKTGKSTMENLIEIRLTKSTVLLKSTDISISEIAYSVGFSDPKHFSQMFKRKYNLTPGEYRSKKQF